MPLVLDPTETFDVVLRGDQASPAPATFVFRYMSAREIGKTAQLDDAEKLRASRDTAKVIGMLIQAVAMNLTDWRNVRDRSGEAIPFAPERLDEILTVGELWELFYSARRQSKLSVPEKNASASQSPGNMDESVTAANPANRAPTPSVPTAPRSSSAQDAEAPAAASATAEAKSH